MTYTWIIIFADQKWLQEIRFHNNSQVTNHSTATANFSIIDPCLVKPILYRSTDIPGEQWMFLAARLLLLLKLRLKVYIWLKRKDQHQIFPEVMMTMTIIYIFFQLIDSTAVICVICLVQWPVRDFKSMDCIRLSLTSWWLVDKWFDSTLPLDWHWAKCEHPKRN